MTLCVGVVGGVTFITTRFVSSGDRDDEFMGILAREAQARDHSLPYCNSSKALDSRENVTRRENGQPFHLGTHKEACRSQASKKSHSRLSMAV